MTWHRSIWMLLWTFLGFGAISTLLAIAVGPGQDVDATMGWIALGIVTGTQVVALAALRPRWLTRAPAHLPTAVLTGMFIRIAIGELVFLCAFVLFFVDAADVPILLAGLVVSIVLIWLFAAPTGHNVSMIQDQLERAGGQGDVASDLAAPRPSAATARRRR